MNSKMYLSHSEVVKLELSLKNIDDVIKSCHHINSFNLSNPYNLNEADTLIREFIQNNIDNNA